MSVYMVSNLKSGNVFVKDFNSKSKNPPISSDNSE